MLQFRSGSFLKFAVDEPDITMRILVIEENPSEANLIRLALAEAASPVQVDFVKNRLRTRERLGTYRNGMLPAFILLSIKYWLPEDGQFIAQLRGEAVWASVPVVVFSALDRIEDREAARAAGASIYLRKPGDAASYFSILVSISRQFESRVTEWRGSVTAPASPSAMPRLAVK
ncbi:MAG: hypothetical protein ACK5AZ_24835 [Bryobacteraceae bacterium]